ncbi:MAG: hypothetical protein H6Q59_1585 [Firmicutes bacterium]|nr:hypothetical protein [Bacillota bacterium]
MNGKFYSSGNPSGFQYETQKNLSQMGSDVPVSKNNSIEMEGDLIFEDNTVYEVDRECFERLKRQKKKRL